MSAAADPAATGAGVDADLDAALARIAAGADERERPPVPPFPADAFDLLRDAGALAFNATAGTRRPPAARELALVRAVAAADGSVGRIFDGHLNAVERLAVHGEGELRERELALVAAGRLRAGVWGGEPLPGEGPSALLPPRAGDAAAGIVGRLRGVRTFCSGAGGLQRALVLAREQRDPQAPPVAAWVDLTAPGEVEVDERWFRGAGMRASASHRVVFHDTAVLARFGGPGELVRQPWFGRDALRTAASWAGIADSAADAALEQLAARPARGELEALAAGQVLAARRTIELWVDAAAATIDRGTPDELARTAALARHAIAAAARELLDVAARACGSRPFAAGGRLDRARRDLELFLLQHRLEPIVARAGAVALDARERPDAEATR